MADLNPSATPLVDAAFLLRIVSAAEPGRDGEEIPVSGPITIGRDEACPMVIHEPSVSRKHARVEPAALEVDLRSAQRGERGPEDGVAVADHIAVERYMIRSVR